MASIFFTTEYLDSVPDPPLVFCLYHPSRWILPSSEKERNLILDRYVSE
jgi:hypothetical protein